MPGFMPGIHVLKHCDGKDVDGRDKPGHDGKQTICWLQLNECLDQAVRMTSLPCDPPIQN
jgi:hypothetical protein